jgi:predicted DNA-binding transcriptional regulator YafY
MWDTSERLLKLLSLLQQADRWTSNALCDELSVTARTVSRDIVRLRNLGYPVITTKGVGGGYTLQRGASIPPIMFSLDEAAAVLLALRPAPTPGATPDAHAAMALGKVQQALPRPVRAAMQALVTHSTSVDLGQPITDSSRVLTRRWSFSWPDPAVTAGRSPACTDTTTGTHEHAVWSPSASYTP